MRRLLVVGSVALAILLLCSGVVYIGSQPPPGLVLDQAEQVAVERLSFGRQRITYMMPTGKTMASIRQVLRQQGWRYLQVDEDVGVQFFSRSLFNHAVRSVITIHRPATSRDPVVIEIGQCLWFGNRTVCF